VLLYRQEKFSPIKVGGIKLEILRIKAKGTMNGQRTQKNFMLQVLCQYEIEGEEALEESIHEITSYGLLQWLHNIRTNT